MKRLLTCFLVLVLLLTPILAMAAESIVVNATGYPVVEEPLTLHFIYGKNDLTDDLVNNKLFQEICEKTGITIEWEYISTDWATLKSTAFMTGELPHAFFGKGRAALTDADIMNNVDYFVPLEDLIAEYAPNLQAILDANPTVRSLITAPDGHIYSLPQRMPLRPVTYDVGFINKTWLDNLGLEMPTTTEEFTEVLRAFKEQDANGNGDPNDEIPLCFTVAAATTSINDLAGPLSLLGAFGIADSMDNRLVSVENDEVIYWPTDSRYKDAIIYLNSLNNEGLIDIEAFTQEFGQVTAKFRNPDEAIVGVGFHWTIPAGVTIHADEYVQLLPLKGPNGDQLWRRNDDKSKGGRNYFSITTLNPSPEASMRFIDEFYAPENSLQAYFGSLDVGLTKEADGTYSLLPPQDDMSEDAWMWKNGLNDSGPLYVSPEMEVLVNRNPWINVKLDYDDAYAPYLPEQYFPPVYWSSEQSNEITMLNADIQKFVLEKMAQWVTSGGIEEEWDSYLDQLDKMNLGRLVEIYQDGYDSYFGK